MNALIFTEDNNLHLTKPNGLRYQFENVDKPNLGFDFDVLVYDNEEFKILSYDDDTWVQIYMFYSHMVVQIV